MATAVRVSTDEDRNPSPHESESETPPLEPHTSKQQSDTSKSYRYKEIHALMFLWEDDDLHVLNEVNELKAVFDKHYHFTSILISVIPSRKPYCHVKNEIENLRHVLNRTDSLVIVYYSGHGHLFGYGKLTWSAYEKPKSICKLIPGLRWSFLQARLERAPSDVLILLDCCESGGSLRSSPLHQSPTSTSPGTTELIAASPFDTLAPGPGEHSFTGALITELKVLAGKGEMFSVAELHRRVLANIIERRRGWRCRVQREWQWPSVSPVYVRLVGGVEVPSIGLMPLSVRESQKWVAEKETMQMPLDVEVGAAPEMLSLPLDKTRLEKASLAESASEMERRNSSPETGGGMYDEKTLVKARKRGTLGCAVNRVKMLVFKAS